MRTRYLGLGLSAVVLLAGSLGYVLVGTHLYQRYHLAYANYQFAPAGPCGALVAWSPPRTVYTGLYINTPALLTLRYSSPQPQTLRITVGIPRFTQDESVEVQAAEAFQQRAFKPPLQDGAALNGLSGIGAGDRAGQIHLRVQGSAGAACDVTVPVTLKSAEWMHWYDGTASTDNSPLLAGWVTPHAPAISQLIGRTAAWMKQHPESYAGTPALFGYDGGRAASTDVVNQVNALFDTLQSVYHVYYAQDNVPYSVDAAQRIQLPQEVLSAAFPTGMCVETTAILASAVEALGMRAYFIIVPGHAFLGVALGDQPGAPIEYWETSDLNGGISGSQANVHGDAEHVENLAAGKILRVIDIAYERQQGIQPID